MQVFVHKYMEVVYVMCTSTKHEQEGGARVRTLKVVQQRQAQKLRWRKQEYNFLEIIEIKNFQQIHPPYLVAYCPGNPKPN